MTLLRAALAGEAEEVRALLGRGADVNAADRDGWTPLMEAASKGHAAVVRLLLDAGADASARSKAGWTALRAAARGNPVVLELLRKAEVCE